MWKMDPSLSNKEASEMFFQISFIKILKIYTVCSDQLRQRLSLLSDLTLQSLKKISNLS